MPLDDSINVDRYHRQALFAPLGTSGQAALRRASVLVCGCGALGSVIISTLARAGVGHLRIVDRDYLELNNLQRQVLYTEQDVASGLPKAILAAEHVRRINSEVRVEPIVADVQHRNVPDMIKDIDVIADGTDNFETRFLLNDVSLRYGIPWVYGGCLGADGQSMTIVPGETPCLRCVISEPPPPGSQPTCDTAGVLGPIVNLIGSWQAMEVMKLASGNGAAIHRSLLVADIWQSRIRQIRLDALAQENQCVACGLGQYDWLEGRMGTQTVVLCGRNAVQITSTSPLQLSLAELADKLKGIGHVSVNAFLLRCLFEQYELTVFADGRAIVKGTQDPAEARTVLARTIGQ